MADTTATGAQPKDDTPLKKFIKGENGAGLVNAVLLMVARVGANVLALIWTVLLVRLVQPELSGAVFHAISVAQIASVALTLNVESASMRFLVPALHEGRADQAASFIRFNRLLVAGLVIPVSVPLLLMVDMGAAMVLSVIVAMVATALARVTGRHATALGAMRQGLLPRLLTGPAVPSLGLGAAWLAGWPLQPWHVVALFALSEVMAALIQRALLRRVFAFLADHPLRVGDWRQWIGQGLWLTPGLIVNEYRRALLIATAALVLGGADLSRFTVAFSIINVIAFGIIAVDVAFSQPIARAIAAAEGRRRDRLLASSAAIKLAGLVLGAVVIHLLGPLALGWFGPDYADMQPLLWLMLLMPVAAALAGPGSALLTATGHGRSDCVGNVIGAATTVAAICLPGALFGLGGAIWGAVAGMAVTHGLTSLLCFRRLGIDPSVLSIRHLIPGHHPQGKP